MRHHPGLRATTKGTLKVSVTITVLSLVLGDMLAVLFGGTGLCFAESFGLVFGTFLIGTVPFHMLARTHGWIDPGFYVFTGALTGTSAAFLYIGFLAFALPAIDAPILIPKPSHALSMMLAGAGVYGYFCNLTFWALLVCEDRCFKLWTASIWLILLLPRLLVSAHGLVI